MEQRAFGNTGLTVSLLGLGASHVGNTEVSEEDAGRMLNTVLDAGVTLLDTATGYGLSEERIGRHVAHRRDQYVLSTKGGYGVAGVENWTPQVIERGVEQSLKRMNTDRIDIFHLHSCELDTLKQSGVAEALERMVTEGKVRVAAYSGENRARAWAIQSGKFRSIQTSLNVCDQRVLDEDLPACDAKQLGVIVKRPLANAFWRFKDRPVGDYSEVYWHRAHQMRLEPPDGMAWDEFALRFAAFQPGVCSVIAGTNKAANFARNMAVIAQGPLPADVVASTRALFAKHDNDWTGEV